MMAKEKSSTVEFKFLKEELPEQDMLGNRSHQNIANTLFEVITNSTSAVTIGLDGERGSGKSVVIKLLDDKLKANPKTKTKLFLFDVWGHEKDPIRLVFLEKFLDWLMPEEKDKKIQDDKYAELQKKIKYNTSITKSSHQLGRFGFVVVVLTFISSIAAAIISNSEFDSELFWYIKSWGFDFAVLLLATGIVWAVYYFNKLEKNKVTENNLSVWNNEVEVSESVECCDKISTDFENLFVQLLDDYFADNDKLVIVLDNLDRVDDEDFERVISMIRIFMQAVEGEKYKDKVWFIIPYVSRQPQKTKAGENEAGPWELKKSTNLSQTLSSDFFDKCFQLRIDVPKPILVSWEGFFSDCLDACVPPFVDWEQKTVLANFKILKGSDGFNVNIREIKNFINQISLLREAMKYHIKFDETDKKLQQKQNDLLNAICYYVYYRFVQFKDVSEIIDELITHGKDNFLSNLDERTKSYIASIIYGINENKALQLLYYKKLRNAITTFDEKTLERLQTYRFFKYIFNLVAQDIFVSPEDFYLKFKSISIYSGSLLPEVKRKMFRDFEILLDANMIRFDGHSLNEIAEKKDIFIDFVRYWQGYYRGKPYTYVKLLWKNLAENYAASCNYDASNRYHNKKRVNEILCSFKYYKKHILEIEDDVTRDFLKKILEINDKES